MARSAITCPARPANPFLPPVLNLALDCTQTLRYGENPHQAAGLYP